MGDCHIISTCCEYTKAGAEFLENFCKSCTKTQTCGVLVKFTRTFYFFYIKCQIEPVFSKGYKKVTKQFCARFTNSTVGLCLTFIKKLAIIALTLIKRGVLVTFLLQSRPYYKKKKLRLELVFISRVRGLPSIILLGTRKKSAGVLYVRQGFLTQ